jgi:NADH dehydrogenase/NADH:ubiquinone oxidoreductase subunit G
MTDTQATELTLRLDGEVVRFTLGETLYEVAQRHGKVIPTLCYDPRLEAFGACRLCVVEVKGARVPVASCTTLAMLDTEVSTDSERLQRHRKTLLEMVASENGGAIEVDPLRGYASQELGQLVAQHEARTDRFVGAHSGASKLDDPNPFILRDYDRCISCYRCVRVCAEQEGDYAISVANRGFATQITVEFAGDLRDSACTFCGQCVQTCPTGALADKKAMRYVAAE